MQLKSKREDSDPMSMTLHAVYKVISVLCNCVADDIEKHACMVTTEISQVPLSGVLAMLKAAR